MLMSMKQSKQEAKVENLLVEEKEKNEYEFPYGLKITIDEKPLRKLEKRPEDFAVGEEVFVAAKARVTSIMKAEGEYSSSHVCLQIEDMSVKEPPKDQSYAEKIYNKEE